jgi:hypothetical protein
MVCSSTGGVELLWMKFLFLYVNIAVPSSEIEEGSHE